MLQSQRGSYGVFVGFPPHQAGFLIYVQERICPNNLVVCEDVTYDEKFNSAVACTTVPVQRRLLERPIGLNIWVKNYDPEREKEDNSPLLFTDGMQTDVQVPIDAPSARTRSKKAVMDIPSKVPKSDAEM
eukprot:11494569-Ditylum_brightwellii.AAC.1